MTLPHDLDILCRHFPLKKDVQLMLHFIALCQLLRIRRPEMGSTCREGENFFSQKITLYFLEYFFEAQLLSQDSPDFKGLLSRQVEILPPGFYQIFSLKTFVPFLLFLACYKCVWPTKNRTCDCMQCVCFTVFYLRKPFRGTILGLVHFFPLLLDVGRELD